MGCCTGLFRIILVIVNLIVGLVWLAVTIMGGLLAWGTPVITNIVRTYLGSLIDSLSKQTGGTINLDSVVSLVQTLSGPAGIAIFVIALILTFICAFGCFGACCNTKCLLMTYSLAMIVLLAAEIIFVIIYFVRPDLFFNPAKQAMLETIPKFVGIGSSNSESVFWNLLQPGLNCCGVNNYSDFDAATQWNHREIYGGTPYNDLTAPITCCKMTQTYTRQDTSCPTSFDTSNSNYVIGCFGQLQSQIQKYGNIVLFVFIAIIIANALLTSMALGVACTMDQAKMV